MEGKNEQRNFPRPMAPEHPGFQQAFFETVKEESSCLRKASFTPFPHMVGAIETESCNGKGVLISDQQQAPNRDAC